MEEIGVKNYRSIRDSGIVELLPITAIVGKNSAGKSSFIRLFPLIKQTLEKRTAEAMLWFGDYVDLGDFEHAVSRESPAKPIELFLTVKVRHRSYYYLSENNINPYSARITLSILKNYYQKIRIDFEDQTIEIFMDENNAVTEIFLNGSNDIYKNKKVNWYRNPGDLLPRLFFEEETVVDENTYFGRFGNNKIFSEALKLIYGSKISQNKYRYPMGVLDDIPLSAKENVLASLKKLNPNKFKKMSAEDEEFILVNNYILAAEISNLIETINESISFDIRQTNYVKPIRAMVDRYYRVQGISIEELDADGSNLPMILHNMSKGDLKNFEKWCMDKFGVVFSVNSSEGHISLVMKDSLNSKEFTNVADTGYGYSQMLPIVVLLWMLHNNKNREYRKGISKTIVIEQPELHLHPAYQARMIDVFVNIIREANASHVDLHIIFETHSEVMINRLGKLILANKIGYNQVNVLIFDKENNVTTIESKKFNEKGLLKGWPRGFFAPDEVD